MKLKANRANNFAALALNDDLLILNILEETAFCRQMVSVFIECSEKILVKLIGVTRNSVVQSRIR